VREKKSRIASIREKTKREGKEEKLKEEDKSSTDVANKVVKNISATSSLSRCCFNIIGDIASIPSSCASNLVEAS
jgi:hypothetical protein